MLRLSLFIYNLTGFHLAEREKSAAMVQNLYAIIVVVVPIVLANAITMLFPNVAVLTRPQEHVSAWRETFEMK